MQPERNTNKISLDIDRFCPFPFSDDKPLSVSMFPVVWSSIVGGCSSSSSLGVCVVGCCSLGSSAGFSAGGPVMAAVSFFPITCFGVVALVL